METYKKEARVTAEDRAEIERYVANGFKSGRVDSDEGQDTKHVSWELEPNGAIKIIDVWYA